MEPRRRPQPLPELTAPTVAETSPETGPISFLGNTANFFDNSTPKAGKEWRNSALFGLAGHARKLAWNEGVRQGLKHPDDWHKVAQCHWATFDVVNIAKTETSAFWRGVVVCGKAWACPVCATRIQAHRRAEIAQAMAWAYSTGKKAVMLTLTFPHRSWDKLPALLKAQAKALERFRSHRAIRGKFDTAGLIRALELTHGKNGWHPHTHELHFLPADTDAEAFRVACLEAWRACCAKSGLLDLADKKAVRDFNRRAVDVIDHADAADYLAKLADTDPRKSRASADREMASASTKQGRAKGRNLFQLLADSAEGDEVAGFRYIEAIDALRGRAWLRWSPGLRRLVNLAEVSDEEVAEAPEAPETVAFLSPSAWKFVRSNGNARGALLDVAERGGGLPAVLDWLRSNGWDGSGVDGPAFAPISKA
jgi:hypothetical protein